MSGRNCKRREINRRDWHVWMHWAHPLGFEGLLPSKGGTEQAQCLSCAGRALQQGILPLQQGTMYSSSSWYAALRPFPVFVYRDTARHGRDVGMYGARCKPESTSWRAWRTLSI